MTLANNANIITKIVFIKNRLFEKDVILLTGFSASIFIDQENFMLNRLTKNAGAKIVVHDPSMAPMPDEYGIDLQPNTGSSIAVQAVRIL
jgi:hypothetical protein